MEETRIEQAAERLKELFEITFDETDMRKEALDERLRLSKELLGLAGQVSRAYITERPKLLAEIERLNQLLADSTIGELCTDKGVSDFVAEAEQMEAEAAAFRWLVEKIFKHEIAIEYYSNRVPPYVMFSLDGDQLGEGTTPLEAVENAKRRKEG